MSGRSVLLTGSAGFLGKALRAAFTAQGDVVTGVDCVRSQFTDVEVNLDRGGFVPNTDPDIVICNANTRGWEVHHEMAKMAKMAVINIGSIYGILGCDPEMYRGTEIPETPAHYVAAKGAMIALTKHQATTLAPVRSNCIILGGIYRNHSDEFVRRYCAKVPLRRMATERDAVELCLFLASEKASHLTGACIPLDGGLTAMS